MTSTRRRPQPELWAGPECSRNRVGDRTFDQLDRTGHANRIDDLRLIADLGVRTVRYPVLWERVVAHVSAEPDWTWTDERLGRLRDLGMTPVVGLLHHGNGPSGTNLLDPRFPELFASFARRVAERYPWVSSYVPINEPLTTARFAGLYGIWFPHRRDHESFVRILLHQLRATVLAMEEIRAVNPNAQLIQNEDIGTITSTPALEDRAAYENERRWLTFDLLCGQLGADSPMWPRLLEWRATEAELRWFHESSCRPDILGVDHYLTSDRLLDERLDRYPAWAHGGEDGRRWADIEAVRVVAEHPGGVLGALRAAWERYGSPLAVTEAHLGCTREEQLRWLQETWDAAVTLVREGADVRAICVWMLFGGFDWNTLMTSDTGFYEPGAFDLRGGSPRATAIAGWIRDITGHSSSDHPVLAGPGWWRRPDRLLYPAVRTGSSALPPAAAAAGTTASKRILIVGHDEPLLQDLSRLCHVRGLDHTVLGRMRTDVIEFKDLDGTWAVIGVLDSAADAHGVAEAARLHQRRFLAFSSHMVFAGCQGGPFAESANTAENLWVAREQSILQANPGTLIVRTGPLFGPDGSSDWTGLASPTYLPDALNEALDLLIDGEHGVWHVANRGSVTAAELRAMMSWPTPHMPAFEATPVDIGETENADTSLVSERGSVLPLLQDAVVRLLGEREHLGFPVVAEEWLAAAAAEVGLEASSSPSFDAPAHVPTSTRSSAPHQVSG